MKLFSALPRILPIPKWFDLFVNEHHWLWLFVTQPERSVDTNSGIVAGIFIIRFNQVGQVCYCASRTEVSMLPPNCDLTEYTQYSPAEGLSRYFACSRLSSSSSMSNIFKRWSPCLNTWFFWGFISFYCTRHKRALGCWAWARKWMILQSTRETLFVSGLV